MELEIGKGEHVLYSYLDLDEFYKSRNYKHPDPNFYELTYGDGTKTRVNRYKKHVKPGSHFFFHTTDRGQRCITAHFYVAKIIDGFEARHDETIRKRYSNPHIHPEKYPEWWYEQTNHKQNDYSQETEKIDDVIDVVIFGDDKKSLKKLENPLIFDRDLYENIEFVTEKKSEFGIPNKRGRIMNDSERISSYTRQPRFLTETDVRFLYRKCSKYLDVKKKK